MSDGLRDRIAAALASKEVVLDGWDYINQEFCWLLADAVIAALKLTPETGYGTTYPNVPVEDRKLVRYVTDWWPADD